MANPARLAERWRQEPLDQEGDPTVRIVSGDNGGWLRNNASRWIKAEIQRLASFWRLGGWRSKIMRSVDLTFGRRFHIMWAHIISWAKT